MAHVAEDARVLIFSYGSNNAAQLAGRVHAPGEPLLPPPRAATLHDFARVFAFASPIWRVRSKVLDATAICVWVLIQKARVL
jgi:hypothetical protein